MSSEQYDVVIVGAGLSGIGAAVHLGQRCPDKHYVILEGRAAMGGTWDLFRYPGIRSDSDMHTMSYEFKPWRTARAIAEGDAILRYIEETAAEYDVERHIRYNHKVRGASWSSAEAVWTICCQVEGREVTVKGRFLLICAGYYSYKSGFKPEFPGQDRFQGPIIHPQEWPESLDYAGKRVVVIGSGATAMTLVPTIAPAVAHVTMLQRSPTYVVSRPWEDNMAGYLRRYLPEKLAYRLIRRKNIFFQQYFYRQTREKPAETKQLLLDGVREALGPDFDVETHFTPDYYPWDQRLCLIPDGDLFEALRSGQASVVTDQIDSFTATGIGLASGRELEADIIVTATGLNLEVMGGIQFTVDERLVNFAEHFSYKGVMLSDVPNLISVFGYINASWTLRADLIARFACRLLRQMDKKGARQVTPRLGPADTGMACRPWIENFSSGYIQRNIDLLPRQGDKAPWINAQNYAYDKKVFLKESLTDGVLEYC